MARPQTIDREHLLDQAERIVAHQGASQLSLGSLARASGVAKASIQSTFGSRDQMLNALIDRWTRRESIRYEALVGEDCSSENRLRAHLATTAEETAEGGSRLASTLAALVGSGSHSKNIATWYETRLGSLEASGDAERGMRIAYLAAEGAYYLRHMAGLKMSDECWQDIFKDLNELTSESSDNSRTPSGSE